MPRSSPMVGSAMATAVLRDVCGGQVSRTEGNGTTSTHVQHHSGRACCDETKSLDLAQRTRSGFSIRHVLCSLRVLGVLGCGLLEVSLVRSLVDGGHDGGCGGRAGGVYKRTLAWQNGTNCLQFHCRRPSPPHDRHATAIWGRSPSGYGQRRARSDQSAVVALIADSVHRASSISYRDLILRVSETVTLREDKCEVRSST